MKSALLSHYKARRLYLMAERECCVEGRTFSPLTETNKQKDER
jgi:hypothetical protein